MLSSSCGGNLTLFSSSQGGNLNGGGLEILTPGTILLAHCAVVALNAIIFSVAVENQNVCDKKVSTIEDKGSILRSQNRNRA